MDEDTSSRLNSLPARPPTPPRCSTCPASSCKASQLDVDETLDDAVKFLDKSFEVDRLISSELRGSSFLVDTPLQSPSITSETTRTSSKRKHKVAFAPFTSWDYHKSPNYTIAKSDQTPVKPLPPSRENSSVKSILKFTKQPLGERLQITFNPQKQNNSSGQFSTLPEMLEEIIQQLAGDSVDRSTKVDAYVALCRTLQAYKEVPDIEALKNKTSLLLQFIRRDISPHNSVTKGPHSSIMTAALKLLASLLTMPMIAETVDDQSYTSFIDLSISTLEDVNVSKTMAQHHLSALMVQKFTVRTLKQERFDRLLDAVHGLQDRVKGNKIPEYQVGLYRKLLEQVPDLMALSISKWLDVLLSSLLSDIDEIRAKAINIGLFASLQLAGKPGVSDFISQTFEKDLEGEPYGQFFVTQLNRMLSPNSTATSVPRIWSIVCLLCRANFSKSWVQQNLKLWLSVIQACLGFGHKTKLAARAAWSRYILCVNPGLSTDSSERTRLRIPIDAYFVDETTPESSTKCTRGNLSMYCALLYYSLRPNTPLEQIDRYWKEYVSDVLEKFARKSKDHTLLACNILTSLFESTASWKEMRAVDETMFTINELPRLDPKWVRSRISSILDLIQVLIQCEGEFDSFVNTDPSPVERMWVALINSIADASSKEITLSHNMKISVANLTNFFCSPRFHPLIQSKKEPKLVPLLARLIEHTVIGLGASAFAEPFLSIVGSKLEVAASPKRRPTETFCAVPRLIVRLYSLPRDDQNDLELCAAITAKVLHLCCQSRKSRIQKLELLLECAHAAKRRWDDEIFEEQRLSSTIIGPILECAHDIFCPKTPDSGTMNYQLGRDYERALQLMQKCLPYMTLKFLETFQAFYSILVESAKTEAGHGGLLLAVTTEHAALVTSCLKGNIREDENLTVEFLISYISIILKYDVRPKKITSELQKARVALWGETAKFAKDRRAEDLDPYLQVYDVVNVGLELVYKKMQEVEKDFATNFLDSVRRYLEHTPASFRSTVLSRIQNGIAILVRDQSRILKPYRAVRAKVKKLWDLVLAILSDRNEYTSNFLNTFETIIIAGLSSSRKSTINSMVNFWNSTFGKTKTLEYTDKIEQSLRHLRPFVKLELPNWKEEADDTVLVSPLSLDESGGDTGSDQELQKCPQQLESSPTSSPIRVSLSPTFLQRNTMKRCTSSPSHSTARRLVLRHNDSQINLNPIESSPAQGYNNMQDKQKEVPERQCQDSGNLFFAIQSKSVYHRFQHLEDMCNPVLGNEPVNERPSTPSFADEIDAVEGELPKSSSPPRSSPIVAAMSRRSTPRKPLETDRTQAEEDDLPSSPPLQNTDELDTETQSFNMFDNTGIQEVGTAGFDDIQEYSGLLNPDVDKTLVEATINPTHLTSDVAVSHDDLVQQARQQFEAVSSFSAGTDFISGTEDNRESGMESVLIPATYDTPRKVDVLLHGSTATNEPALASPTLSSSGFLAEAQLIAEIEASTQRIGDQENSDTQQSTSTSSSQIPAITEKIVGDTSLIVIPATFTEDIDGNMQQIPTAPQSNIPLDPIRTPNAIKRKAESNQFDMVRSKMIKRHSVPCEVEASLFSVAEPNRPQIPNFDKIEGGNLHRILDVFNQQPDAGFDEIVLTPEQMSRECYTESGRAKRFKAKEARDAWNKMNNEQRTEALRDMEDEATQQAQNQVVTKRRRHRRRKSQSRWRLSSADQQDVKSTQATSQNCMEKTCEVTTLQSAQARQSNQVSNTPNLERCKPSYQSEVSDAMNTDPVHARDSLPSADRRRKKRRSSQLTATREQTETSEPELEIIRMTTPRLFKKRRIEVDHDAFQPVKTPPRDVPRRRATDVRLTPRNPLSLRHSSLASNQDQPPLQAFNVRQGNTPTPSLLPPPSPPFVPGTYNEEVSSPTLSPKTFFERFTSFSEKWRKMFEDCKRIIGRLPSQERQQVHEKLEEMGNELIDVNKVVGKANRKN